MQKSRTGPAFFASGELTDDELDQIEGKQDQIIGKLREKYGYSRERAEREYRDFEANLYSGSTRRY